MKITYNALGEEIKREPTVGELKLEDMDLMPAVKYLASLFCI